MTHTAPATHPVIPFAVTTPGAAALRIEAYYHGTEDAPTWARIGSDYFATEAEAQEFMVRAALPKSTGARVTRVGLGDRYDRTHVYYVRVRAIKLVADDANGGRNEAGIRRYRTVKRAAGKAGVVVDVDPSQARSSNRYASVAAFEAAIA